MAKSSISLITKVEKNNRVHFTAVLDRFAGKGGLYFIGVPDRVAKTFTSTKPVRMVCTLNNTVEFHCAIRPKGGGLFYINVAATHHAKAKLTLGQKIAVTVRPDQSEYGRQMPKELKELMEQDANGNKLFHELTPSKQRGIIHYVDSDKSIDKRIERALMMINRLKNKA